MERVDFTRPKQSLAIEVIRAVYRKDGLRGFYRGYTASVLCYVPNSAMFWTFYMLYSGTFIIRLIYGISIGRLKDYVATSSFCQVARHDVVCEEKDSEAESNLSARDFEFLWTAMK